MSRDKARRRRGRAQAPGSVGISSAPIITFSTEGGWGDDGSTWGTNDDWYHGPWGLTCSSESQSNSTGSHSNPTFAPVDRPFAYCKPGDEEILCRAGWGCPPYQPDSTSIMQPSGSSD
ncbi:hypothetical protein K438DRAFT_1969058 [Mycena galopus ATCC 62051]|nr:hypothetical protein K438DRAFT_1969058 [Mycena galopus ATCC 62051]